jgi:hypothetical protein
MRLPLTIALFIMALVPWRAVADDAGDIRHLMMATFDKPEAPLTLGPIVARDDLAIAGWAQGDMGGRALLREEDGAWALSLCAGDALRRPAALEQLGLSAAQALSLADAVVAAESQADPVLVAKFSRFEGIVTMSEDGDHGRLSFPWTRV